MMYIRFSKNKNIYLNVDSFILIYNDTKSLKPFYYKVPTINLIRKMFFSATVCRAFFLILFRIRDEWGIYVFTMSNLLALKNFFHKFCQVFFEENLRKLNQLFKIFKFRYDYEFIGKWNSFWIKLFHFLPYVCQVLVRSHFIRIFLY